MNFLSHYYFEKQNPNSNMIMGTVLPDLVKNAHKDWNLYPQKRPTLFNETVELNAILDGWKRHLEVDLLFHSSIFFADEMAKLKLLLLPILGESPVRPSFLAHIGVELMLDHLLVVNHQIDIDSFYMHLGKVDDQILNDFLKKCGAADTSKFFAFLTSFKSSRYLLSYQKIENISYALQRICMRLWTHPFSEEMLTELTAQLQTYKLAFQNNYMAIFEEINPKLKS